MQYPFLPDKTYLEVLGGGGGGGEGEERESI